MLNRRRFAALATMGLASCRALAGSENLSAPGAPALRRPIEQQLAELDRTSRGRLGVAILDTATGAHYAHRAHERFLLCSTFKLLASAYVLRRVDRGQESLDRRIAYDATALLSWSPVTEKHVADGMTLGALCEAAITYSDNAAANLILASYGGPPALTAFVRTLGDDVTRVDRTEPALNAHGHAGDMRDTTSPHAMLRSLQKLVLGDALSAASRTQLQQWLRANTTGEHRLKAGLPDGWTIGDKTGSFGRGDGGGTSNDVAVVWPPDGRAPLLVAAFLMDSAAPSAARDATLASVGRLLPAIVVGAPRGG
ncbi:MAG TPA: class A beta-lactamase [Burkholderiaceae bacterium]